MKNNIYRLDYVIVEAELILNSFSFVTKLYSIKVHHRINDWPEFDKNVKFR